MALVLTVRPAAAQTVGFRAGVTSASPSFSTEETFSVESRTGYAYLAFMSFDPNGFLSIQPEIGYQTKGFGYSGEEQGEVELGYLEMDLLVKAGGTVGSVRLGALGGIGAGANITCNVEGSTCEDLGVNVNHLDWSAILGGEMAWYLGSFFSIWGDARYVVGLTNVNSTDEVFQDLKNRAWILTLGVGFGM